MTVVDSPEIQDFLSGEKQRQKQNTYENRRSGLKAFDEWLQTTGKGIDEIDFMDIEDFCEWLTTQKGNGGVSDITADVYIRQVKQFYKRRKKKQMLENDGKDRVRESELVTPVDNAELNLNRSETKREKQTHENVRKGLKPEEMNQIIESADSFKHQLILKCLGGLGCRPSDLRDLRKQDVDLENNRVKIRSTKTTNSRKVPISDSLREYLNLWLDRGYRDTCYYSDSTDWLIPGERSEQVGKRTITRIVSETAEEAGLQDSGIYRGSDGREYNKITPYSFRSGFASHMKSKVSPKELQYLMGHQKIETTLRFYTEITEEDLDRIQTQVPDI